MFKVLKCSKEAEKIISEELKSMASLDIYIDNILKSRLEKILKDKGFEDLMKLVNEVILCYRIKADSTYDIELSSFYRDRYAKWVEAKTRFLNALRDGITMFDAFADFVSKLKKVVDIQEK